MAGYRAGERHGDLARTTPRSSSAGRSRRSTGPAIPATAWARSTRTTGANLAVPDEQCGPRRRDPERDLVPRHRRDQRLRHRLRLRRRRQPRGLVLDQLADGKIKWLEDCHGDTYSVFPGPQAVYVASHSHSCANILGEGATGRGFPNMPSGTAQRAIAFSRAATGTVTTNREGNYPNFAGNPAPSLLNFFPQMSQGSYTGQSQAAWTVQGSSDGKYVVYGGEFPRVQSSNQQGLVRFAIKDIAPNKQGPEGHRDFVAQPVRGHADPAVAASGAGGVDRELRLGQLQPHVLGVSGLHPAHHGEQVLDLVQPTSHVLRRPSGPRRDATPTR